MKKFQREKNLTYLFIAHDLSVVRFISDRIGVIYKGRIVEVADSEELFNFPLHPYTRSLISAIPIPDPQLEKNKVLFTYDPSVHDYSVEKPEFVCIGHNHWVYGNKKEIEEYRAVRDADVPLKAVTISNGAQPEHHTEVEDDIPVENITQPPVHDTGSVWYTVFSFLLPVLGILLGLLFKHFKHMRNFRACRKGAIAGFVVIAVIIVLFLLMLLLAVI